MNELVNYLFEAVQSENDVERIRDEILDLAVQGKIEGSRNTEKAEKLLEFIKQKRDNLSSKRKVKSNFNTDGIEEPFKIPKNWVWSRLGDVLLIKSSKRVQKKDWKSEGIPFYRAREIVSLSKNNYVNNDLFISEDHFLELKNSYGVPQKDDLMVTGVGTIGTTYVVKENDEFYFKDASVLWLENFANLNPYFIKIFMHSNIIKNLISKDAMGTTVNTLTIKKANALPFPLPPLEEQERIVNKVYELFAICDKLAEDIRKKNNFSSFLNKAVFSKMQEPSFNGTNTALQFAIDHMNDLLDTKEDVNELRKGILSLAMRGKLSNQHESDGSASEIINRIEEEKQQLVKDKKIRKPRALDPISTDEIPFDIPENWQWVKVGNAGLINPRNQANDELEASFIPMKLILDGIRDSHFAETKKWKDIKKGYTHVAENDVVVAKITPCFQNRKSAVMRNLSNGVGAGTTEFMVFRPLSQELILSDYVLLLFKTEEFIQKGVSTFTGTAGQQRVSKDLFENTMLPLPPIKEQHRIVEKVNYLFEICNILESQLEDKDKYQQLLNHSII